MNYKSLTSMQIDALKEVFNIGSGNSITALSSVLNKKIDMSVPKINIVNLRDILCQELERDVVAVLVKVLGEAPGSILYVFDEDVAKKITEALVGFENDVLSDIGISAIGEIGNIIASSYMNSIATFTGLKMAPSVPAVAYDSFNAIIASTYIDSGQYDDYILEIETLFNGDDGSNIMGNFYYIPEPGSLKKILIKLGMS